MAIATKQKELAAVGISVAAGCRPCLDYHFKAVCEAGASEEEIKSAIVDGISVRTTATDIMAAFALEHIGESSADSAPVALPDGHSTGLLIAIGAAFAVNCVVSLEQHLKTAEDAGTSRKDIEVILELSQMIKGRAAHHAQRLCKAKHKIAISESGKL